MLKKDQPAGGPDEHGIGHIVALNLHDSPEMIVLRTWTDAITNELWCDVCWFAVDRTFQERSFPAALLRKVEG